MIVDLRGSNSRPSGFYTFFPVRSCLSRLVYSVIHMLKSCPLMTFLPVPHASHLNYVGAKLAALRSPSIHVPFFLMTQACLIGPNIDLLCLSPDCGLFGHASLRLKHCSRVFHKSWMQNPSVLARALLNELRVVLGVVRSLLFNSGDSRPA